MEDHLSSRRRSHFILVNTSQANRYFPIKRKIIVPEPPEPSDRVEHGNSLFSQLSKLRPIAEEAKRQQTEAGIALGLGLQIQFSSFRGIDLAIQNLSDTRAGIELRNVRRDEHYTYATVFVPDGKLAVFEEKIQAYLAERKKANGDAWDNKALINTIQEIRAAAFNELWTDDSSALPSSEEESIWWEVWLSAQKDRNESLHSFRNIATQIGFEVSPDELHFPERIVLLVHGSQQQIQRSVMLLNSIAELRRAKETAEFFDALKPIEQREWVDELLNRTEWSQADTPYVCILDTGVNAGHPLLMPTLAPEDMHSVEPTAWGVDDKAGHGTGMAGVVVWGDLAEAMDTSNPVVLTHRLESVKLLPHNHSNAGRHHGNLTIEAVARPESSAPSHKRVFSMAVTAKDQRDRGRPSAWSATLDGLACDVYGEGLTPRLIVVSAGNIDDAEAWKDYPSSNTTDSIHDPGQAWNIITVGAYTEKTRIVGADAEAYSPLAPAGGLSPFSTTSATWDQKQWPLKPDVVFEGGNLAITNQYQTPYFEPKPSLSLLTTNFQPSESLLTVFGRTSAATALCSRMAAQIMAQYPNIWPETVRALIVHSAEWTPQMRVDFLGSKKISKRNYGNLIRHYGFGVPNLERALWSASNSLTLIVQDELQPFMCDKGKNPTLRDMHLHELPWPKTELESLGATQVELRVTLSYFIEPSPGIVERGGGGRYRYESHGLRFDVKRPAERLDEFRARLNQRVRDEEEGSYSGGGSDPCWRLGPDLRHLGSLHSDAWKGTAAELAERGILAIYPVAGWWKNRKKLERYDKKARYALIVSIHTEETKVDLYDAIENLITVSSRIVT